MPESTAAAVAADAAATSGAAAAGYGAAAVGTAAVAADAASTGAAAAGAGAAGAGTAGTGAMGLISAGASAASAAATLYGAMRKPPPVATMPALQNPSGEAAALSIARRAAGAGGLATTNPTGPQGLIDPATTAQKTLLGG